MFSAQWQRMLLRVAALMPQMPRNRARIYHSGRYSGAQTQMKAFMRTPFDKVPLAGPVFLLLLILLMPAVPVTAKQDSVLDQLFTIRDIRLDETAANANRARQAALAKAEVEAYEKLLRKITQPGDRALLPELSTAERQGLISGIDFVDEQSSSRRYLATVNVRFEPSRVSAFLASYSVPHVLGTGRAILVLHSHRRGLANYLWDTDQSLEAARAQVDWLNRIRGYRFARGEIRERLAVSAEEVQALRADAALTVASHNRLESAVLISSSLETAADGSRLLAYDYLATDSGVTGTDVVPFGDGDETAALVAMYDQILEVIDSAWRERLLVDTGRQGEMEVLLPTLSLDNLALVEQRLAEISLLQHFELRQIGLPMSRLYLRFTGREDQLALALRFAGLDLKPYGEQLMIELRK